MLKILFSMNDFSKTKDMFTWNKITMWLTPKARKQNRRIQEYNYMLVSILLLFYKRSTFNIHDMLNLMNEWTFNFGNRFFLSLSLFSFLINFPSSTSSLLQLMHAPRLIHYSIRFIELSTRIKSVDWMTSDRENRKWNKNQTNLRVGI